MCRGVLFLPLKAASIASSIGLVCLPGALLVKDPMVPEVVEVFLFCYMP